MAFGKLASMWSQQIRTLHLRWRVFVATIVRSHAGPVRTARSQRPLTGGVRALRARCADGAGKCGDHAWNHQLLKHGATKWCTVDRMQGPPDGVPNMDRVWATKRVAWGQNADRVTMCCIRSGVMRESALPRWPAHSSSTTMIG